MTESPAKPPDGNVVIRSGDPARRLIKGNCHDCAHYMDCPRLKGLNICYGKKTVLIQTPVAASSPTTESHCCIPQEDPT